nr:SCO family protein [Massilia sp. JS1662]
MNQILRPLFCLLAALLVAAAAGCTPRAPTYHGIDLAGAPYRSDFALAAGDGTTRSLDDFAGKYVMLFFGYTQCPDVCPTALTRALEIRRRLGPDKDRIRVVFITVDPERDTPNIVREYVRAFDPTFVGLSGTAAQTAQAAANYRVVYRKVPNDASYSMDHTALTFVVDPHRRVRLAFPHAQSAQECADDLAKMFRYDRDA